MTTPASAASAARDLDGLRQRLEASADGGRLLPVELREIALGAGTLAEVPRLAADATVDGPPVVFGDRRRIAGGGHDDVKAALVAALGDDARAAAIGGEAADLHADAATLDAAAEACAGAGVIVSVGSGTLTDIAKVAASRVGCGHVAVQTAASVNGFSDAQSVLLKEGVKRTVDTRWPDALVIDTGVLAEAPLPLNQAGLGDSLAVYTAPADWRLAQIVGQDDSYAPIIVELALEPAANLLSLGEGVARADEDTLAELAGILALHGIGFGAAGRTAPGSGMEHTVSHLVEMRHSDGSAPAADLVGAPLHGAKVGITSTIAAVVWRRMLDRAALGELRFPGAEEMEARVREAFAPLGGAAADECWNDYAKKLARWTDDREHLAGVAAAWDEHAGTLRELVAPPEDLARALAEAGAPMRLSDLGVPADVTRWAVQNCHLMRNRFTIADLAFLTGAWEDADVDAVLAEADALGIGT